ncbi:MAG: sialidase [Blastopirellula sp.]|nr:MAG: sialidase [Blastopirellula sp.]
MRNQIITQARYLLVAGLILIAGRVSLGEEIASPFKIELDVFHKGYDGKQCWVHARAGVIPATSKQKSSQIVLTTQPLQLHGSDVFNAIHSSTSSNHGKTWSPLVKQQPFIRKSIDDQTEVTVCDFTPKWHAATKKLLGTGQTVWYQNNKVMSVRPRATAYAVFDESTQAWSKWKELILPNEPRFKNCGAGSVQRFDLPNGDILLPVYLKVPNTTQYSVSVLRCRFDGSELTYVEQGNELTINVKRGLYEPSLTQLGDRFYLTMRNDDHGYISTSEDGLNFSEPQRWKFDDGQDLGNYNTQQHWVTHKTGIWLVYTRKGANNDHVFRHRAPLFIAQVNPETLRVIRQTEQILVPERGARLGNFGVTAVGPNETWVVVTEWMQTWGPNHIIPTNNKHGADNNVFVAKLKWK